MFRSCVVVGLVGLAAVALILGCGREPGEREFRSGVREIERGNYVRGKALLEKSINKRPGSDANAAAYNYVGIASWKLGQVQRAIEAFEYSHRLNPALAEPTYNLAVLRFDSGDAAQATALLEEASLADPSSPRALEFLGGLYIREQRWAEARRALLSALARSPQSARVLTTLAQIEVSTGDAEKAIFYLMQALEKNSQYAPALYDLGVLYQCDVKDPEQAALYFRKYLESEGRDSGHEAIARDAVRDLESTRSAPASPVSLPVSVATVQPAVPTPAPSSPASPRAPATLQDGLRQAREEFSRGHAAGALNLFLDASGRAEREGDAALQEKILREAAKLCFDQARAHYALGRFLAGTGQNDAAMRSFKQAITLDPKFVVAQQGLADAAIQAGEFDTALVALRQAVQLDPGSADTMWTLASLYDHPLEIPDKAAQGYREFERRFPGDPRVLKAKERLREIEPAPVVESRPELPESESVAAAQPAPESEPAPVPSPMTRDQLRLKKTVVRNTAAAVQAYNRGTMYQQQQDWDRAEYYYCRAVENDDSFAHAFFNLGAVYTAKGEPEMALEAYGRALQLRPDAADARYNLALVYRDLKKRDAAIEQLETVVKMQPDYSQAHYVLGLLYAERPETLAQAKEHYRKFIALSPTDPSAPVLRDWIMAH